MFRLMIILGLSFNLAMASVSLAPRDNRMVKQMIAKVHQKYNIPVPWLEHQFQSLNMNESCLKLMQKPFEAAPWMKYKAMMLSQKRIASGHAFLKQHQETFQYYESQYQIPAAVVAAIIGIETSYGHNKGDFHVLEALATLALYYTPRSQFFYDETISLLDYAYHHDLDLNTVKSSYAGAVGIPQFMPSNIKRFGKHHGHKGQLDLYNNTEDAIASVFNYLKESGHWQPQQPTIKKLPLPAEKHTEMLEAIGSKRLLLVTPDIEHRFNLKPAEKSWIIKLQTDPGTYRFYRVFHNFRSIMSYNNSVHYSAAVIELAQHLDHRPGN